MAKETIIKQLDSITINKIAAGEVIDRPVSIVKELIENAIDAGATAITIEIKDGGKQLIRVTDNGHGIHKDDLPLAPLRHATSKITQLDDIYHNYSFGFRGEALSSICHCAKLNISSKQADSEAYQITAYQDEISEPSLCSHPNGTSIEVHDLFFNLPVRQKFLKSDATELAYILECCNHFSLIHPNIDFIVISNGSEKLNSTGISDLYTLILKQFGKQNKDQLIPIEQQVGPIYISGYISSPTLTFSNRQKQVISVNGRLIKNPLIQAALTTAYKDQIPHRRFPLSVLNIKIEQSLLDVNIHPQKQDIKFINPGLLFDALPKAISLALNASKKHTEPLEPFINNTTPLQSPTPEKTETIDFTQFETSPNEKSTTTPIQLNNPGYSIHSAHDHSETISKSSELFAPLEQAKIPLKAPESIPNFEFLQILDTYIIVKTPDGAYMIDQHAVHERILYEKIKEKANTEQSRQVLLISEIIPVTADDMSVFEESKEHFNSLNFIIEAFGTDQLVVREIPISFQKVRIPELVLSILEQLKTLPGSKRDLTLDQKEILQMQACKAAIKAGQTLSELEIKALLKDFINAPQNYTCPHGRPLFILFDKKKLENLFNRT